MMYEKAVLFSDLEVGAQILQSTSPETQKALGRKVKNFDKRIWEAKRLQIVTEGNYHKFVHSLKTGEDLKAMLLETGDKELVEASPMDRIWGVGFAEKNALDQRAKWGLNLLGKAVMEARKRIKKEVGEAGGVRDLK